MSDGDAAEPKAGPLRVPVLDVPIRNSLVAPEAEPDFRPMAMDSKDEPRPSVIPQPVRVVSDPAPVASAPTPDEPEVEEEAPLELSPMEASVEAAADRAAEMAAAAQGSASEGDDAGGAGEAEAPEAVASYDDLPLVDNIPSIDPSDTLELDPDDGESIEPPKPSMAQPPPPPVAAASTGPSGPPPAPPARPSRTSVTMDDDEEANAVVIDLTQDEPDAVAATAVPPLGSEDEPAVGRRSQATPPPPPASLGPSGAAAHRVADLKPSKPRKQHWWESFFNDDYLRSVRPPSREAVARRADFIAQRLGLEPGATVLDVGCGWGTDVVELSTRGYLGVGLDLSLAMLSRAADEAQERGQRINFLHADMREMNFDGTFDAVVCLGTTFGYFDDETNRQVIARLRRALKPQGVLLLESVNRDHVIRSQPNLVWFEGDGCVCMEETEFNYFTSRLHVKRTVILDDGRQRENEYSVRLYSLHEIGQMLHHQGFRVTEVSGRMSVPGVFFGQESPGLLVVAERRADGTGKFTVPPLEHAFEDDDD